jgi:hypothetical protein
MTKRPRLNIPCEKCGHITATLYTKVRHDGVQRRMVCKSTACGHRWNTAPDPTSASQRTEEFLQRRGHQLADIVEAVRQTPMTADQIARRFSISSRDIYDLLTHLHKGDKQIHVGDYLRHAGAGSFAAIYHYGEGEDVAKPGRISREEAKRRAAEKRAERRAAEKQQRQAKNRLPDEDRDDALDAARKARLAAKIQPFRDRAVTALFGNRAYVTVTRRQNNAMGQTEKVLRTIGRHAERSPSQAGEGHVC